MSDSSVVASLVMTVLIGFIVYFSNRAKKEWEKATKDWKRAEENWELVAKMRNK